MRARLHVHTQPRATSIETYEICTCNSTQSRVLPILLGFPRSIGTYDKTNTRRNQSLGAEKGFKVNPDARTGTLMVTGASSNINTSISVH